MLALTAATLTLAAPGVARAGTASVVGGNPVETGTATFRAAPGEVNDVTATEGHPFEHIFTDAASMIAGRGCTSTGPTSASCTATRGVIVDLRDMDDRGRIEAHSGVTAQLLGGAGDDTISADSFVGSTEVRGQGGDDSVTAGGEGGQIADGGPGNDSVHCCGFSGTGTALGGSGADLIRYEHGEGGGIDIDAGTGDDAVVATPTAFHGSAAGGAGDDVIVIDGTNPRFFTPVGYDVTAGDGDDTVVGGPQDDTIDAGADRDFVDVRGGGADTVTCGDGQDIVRYDAADTIDPDCEIQLAG